jgi:hypothetical protein
VPVRTLIATFALTLLIAAVADAPTRSAIAAAADAPARPATAKGRALARAVAAAPVGPRRLVAAGGIEEAQRWARHRAGTVAFAVAEGRRIRGVAIHRTYYSASVVKAMLALAVLRAARDRELTADERGLLRPMITYSDNDAASAVYGRVGAGALYSIARDAGMRHFGVGFNWADALLTAYDQARLFLRIDRLTPRRHRGYFRALLASIVPSQRWGIAPVAEERGFHIMFKGGWRTGIFHQVALLERNGKRIALAVLTRSADHGYGRETQSGIASRVLAPLASR